jgi:uncharacterized protein YbaR (Trm112 family)
MNCKKCDHELLTIVAKCYDNYELWYSKEVKLDQLGLNYDGKSLHIPYCINCGHVHGNIPVMFKSDQIETQEVNVADYIKQFHTLIMEGDTANAFQLLRWLSVRISPIDHEALATLAGQYLDMRNLGPYPEFDSAVEWMLTRYHLVTTPVAVNAT